MDAVATAMLKDQCAKTFAYPVKDGRAAIRNQTGGDRLEFVWDAEENNALSLWLTRGGWHGHHHFAIEPTNADGDSLAVAAARKHCGTVAGTVRPAGGLCLRVGFWLLLKIICLTK